MFFEEVRMSSMEMNALIGTLILVFFGGGAIVLRHITQLRKFNESSMSGHGEGSAKK